MTSSYCLSDRPPSRSRTYDAFRSLQECKMFMAAKGRLAHGKKIYEVQGTLVRDHTSSTGLKVTPSQIKVIIMG